MNKMILICILLSIFLIIFTYKLNKRKSPWLDKRMTIESGFESLNMEGGIEREQHYYVPFYIIGIIFIIFDLEIVLLFPFVNISLHFSRYLDIVENMEMLIILPYVIFLLFIYFIIYGLYYEYKHNVL